MGLVLTRKSGERIEIGDGLITVTVKEIKHRNAVRLEIDAPEAIRIMRGELVDEMDELTGEVSDG